MAQDKEKNEVVYDLRLLERLLASGRIKQADYDKYLASLPDLGKNIDLIHLAGGSETKATH